MTTRTPLMAGNWKMNLDHLEAIHLVQTLAFSLNDADFAACDVAVMVPFTDIRSVQTLVDGVSVANDATGRKLKFLEMNQRGIDDDYVENNLFVKASTLAAANGGCIAFTARSIHG